MTGNPANSLHVENALSRNALPRIEGGVFDAEFASECDNTPRLLRCVFDDRDHKRRCRQHLPTLSSVNVGADYVGTDYNSAMKDLNESLRDARVAAGLTQDDVAAHFGIARVSVTQWESGKTKPSSSRLPLIADLYKVPLDDLMRGKILAPPSPPPVKASVAKPNASPPVPVSFPGDTIPIMGHAVGGVDGKFVLNGQRVMDTFSPPQLVGVSGAYGVFVHGDSMEPRYFAGEAVFVNPHLPVRSGDFAVVQIGGEFEGDDVSGYVKRFVSMSPREVVLEQFKPREEVDEDAPSADRYTLRFPRNRVIAIHKIIQSGIV